MEDSVAPVPENRLTTKGAKGNEAMLNTQAFVIPRVLGGYGFC